MFFLAVLLFSTMSLREYAHFMAHTSDSHGQSGSAQSSLSHDAKFHFVTEAEAAFEPPQWHQQVVAVILPLCENIPFAQPHLLPETRAPPACA